MKQTGLLWLCNAGMALVALGPSLYPAFLTTFAEEFAIEDTERLGRIAAILFAGFIGGVGIAGPMADRFGPRRFVVGGAVLCVVGLVLTALSNAFSQVLAGAVIVGLGAGILDMVLSPIVSIVAKHDRTRALNKLHAFYAIGAVGWLAIAAIVLQLEASWRAAFLATAIAPALVAVGLWRAPLPDRLHDGEQRVRVRALLMKPGFWLAIGAIALTGATEEGMNQWLPAYAELDLGYTKASAGLALAAFSVLLGIGRGALALLPSTDRVFRTIATSAVLSAGCYVIATLTDAPAIALTACIATGLTCSILWPTVLAATATTYPSGGATMFGILTLAGNFGCLAAPWAIGLAAHETSLRASLGGAAIAPITITIAAVVLMLNHRSKHT